MRPGEEERTIGNGNRFSRDDDLRRGQRFTRKKEKRKGKGRTARNGQTPWQKRGRNKNLFASEGGKPKRKTSLGRKKSKKALLREGTVIVDNEETWLNQSALRVRKSQQGKQFFKQTRERWYEDQVMHIIRERII